MKKRIEVCLVVLALLIVPGSVVHAQLSNSDLTAIAQQLMPANSAGQYYARQGNDRTWMQEKQKSPVARYNPLALTASGLMYMYQHVISPQLFKSCPYYITCSNFAKQSIHQFGLFKGTLIAADRLMRCNRIGLLDVNDMNIDENTHTIIDNPETYR